MENTNSTNLVKLTDPELYSLCKKYGSNAREWMRKFSVLLPEVYKRRLYKKRGFTSIHEFAGKLAGMSNSAVDKVLRVDKNTEDKPELRKKFEEGKVGWSKIEKVLSVATPETDAHWADKVEKLPKAALEAYVQETKKAQPNREDFSPGREITPGKTAFTFRLESSVYVELQKIKQELEKEKKEPLDWNTVMKNILKNGGAKKEEIVEHCENCARQTKAKSRFVPAKIEKLVRAKYNHHCGFKGCNKKIYQLHHTKRYALKKSHDPDGIVPLCKNHNALVHAGLVGNEEKPPNEWVVLGEPNIFDLKTVVDQRVQEYWQGG